MKAIKKNYLVVSILQNGFPLASKTYDLSKKKSVRVSLKSKGDLPLPFYPFPRDEELIQISGKGKAFISSTLPWQGILISGEEAFNISGAERHQLLERPINYASLVYKDLRLLVKKQDRLKPPAKAVKKQTGYGPPLWSFLWHDNGRFVSSLGGVVLSALFIGVLYAVVSVTALKRPSNFKDLDDNLTLPFIHQDNLSTIPEALKSELDRNNYIASTSLFYSQIARLLAGKTEDPYPLLYPTTVSFYQSILSDFNKKIDQTIKAHATNTAQRRKDEHIASLFISATLGQNLPTKLLWVMKKVELMQNGFIMAKERRSAVSKTFREDPEYNWTEYLNIQRPVAQSAEALSKIKVFAQLSNEELMYKEAKDLGIKALAIRDFHDRHSLPRMWLSEKLVTAVQIDPQEKIFAVDHLVGGLNKSYMENLQASQLEEKERNQVTVREPVIGKIDINQVLETVKKNRFQLNLCYDLALRRNQTIQGKMEWQWDIGTKGKISRLKLLSTSIRDERMIECIKQKIFSWQFPKPERGSVRIKHAFTFEQQNG